MISNSKLEILNCIVNYIAYVDAFKNLYIIYIFFFYYCLPKSLKFLVFANLKRPHVNNKIILKLKLFTYKVRFRYNRSCGNGQ